MFIVTFLHCERNTTVLRGSLDIDNPERQVVQLVMYNIALSKYVGIMQN